MPKHCAAWGCNNRSTRDSLLSSVSRVNNNNNNNNNKRKGAQQGDPMGSLEFCEATHLLLINLQSAVKIGFMDDITLAGDVRTVEADVSTI